MLIKAIEEFNREANAGRDQILQASAKLREFMQDEITGLFELDRNLRKFSSDALGLPQLSDPDAPKFLTRQDRQPEQKAA
jgi:hypothetical protein